MSTIINFKKENEDIILYSNLNSKETIITITKEELTELEIYTKTYSNYSYDLFVKDVYNWFKTHILLHCGEYEHDLFIDCESIAIKKLREFINEKT